MKFAAEVNDNEHCDRERWRKAKKGGQKGSHRKETLYKTQSAEIEAIMNYLIPLEFHRANNDEPQPLKLLWNEYLVLKCKLKLSINFTQFVNKEQMFQLPLTIKRQM